MAFVKKWNSRLETYSSWRPRTCSQAWSRGPTGSNSEPRLQTSADCDRILASGNQTRSINGSRSIFLRCVFTCVPDPMDPAISWPPGSGSVVLNYGSRSCSGSKSGFLLWWYVVAKFQRYFRKKLNMEDKFYSKKKFITTAKNSLPRWGIHIPSVSPKSNW